MAVLFCLLLLSSSFASSHAFNAGDVAGNENPQGNFVFDSGIIHVESGFFSANDFKRYIVFGTDPQTAEPLKDNLLFGTNSDNGFFSVVLLEEKSVPHLISQGYHVIEDFRLDYHCTAI